jgi:hypothetical protein|tara:strand:- start:6175 stop:6369 length:195 start_codon:yes stop_codon:yes gene_type:complete
LIPFVPFAFAFAAPALPSRFFALCAFAASSSSGTASNEMASSSYSVLHAGHRPLASSLDANSIN